MSDVDARRELADARPDPADEEVWPDIGRLPGQLLYVLEHLDAELRAASLRGDPVHSRTTYRDTVREARDALIRLADVSPLETWRLLHPPRRDPVDGLVDCRNPDCPRLGFRDHEDRVLHYRRWGLPL